MSSDWDKLFHEAMGLIDHINREHDLLTDWTFGGGTAMMLQINHRNSHDVDLFVTDPQLYGYIRAALEDYQFLIGHADYRADGTRHIKIEFEHVGEIDFIFAPHITTLPAVDKKVEGRTVQLETLSEIVSKKVCYRGSDIKPRDIFDIAAASQNHSDEVEAALCNIPDAMSVALRKLEGLGREYVKIQLDDYDIKPDYKDIAENALEITGGLFRRVLG